MAHTPCLCTEWCTGPFFIAVGLLLEGDDRDLLLIGDLRAGFSWDDEQARTAAGVVGDIGVVVSEADALNNFTAMSSPASVRRNLQHDVIIT